jgi:hypothetical protein
MSITRMTREAWREWHEDRGETERSREASCHVCGKTITIGKVGGFVPSVGDKPVELVCEACILISPADDVQNEDGSETWT